MQPIPISSYTFTTALGHGIQPNLDALLQQRCGLRKCDFDKATLNTYIGRIDALDHHQLPSHLANFNCRNNRLSHLALQQDDFLTACHQAVGQYGAERIAVVVGSTTSGFLEAEHAYQHRTDKGELPNDFHYEQTADPFSAADFIRRYLNLQGPALTINTACSSSAKAFVSAYRMLHTNLCDAVIVGGVDSLCLNVLYGFSALELLSEQPCKPCDENRQGLSLGEAAGFVLLEKNPAKKRHIFLNGYGESCDAYHMSTPHPEGCGAIQAMQQALQSANLSADKIDYINMHGTASLNNDKIEVLAINKIFDDTVMSSTKGAMGHTLGAAGAIEAIISLLCIENDFIPACINTTTLANHCKANIKLTNEYRPVNNVLSNSFGFGGNNCSLVFGR